MWNSCSAFQRGLYAEHIEEMAFLYTQARQLRAAESLPWTQLIDFEWRIAAHLDGLHLGAAAALEEVAARFDADDVGYWSSAALLRIRRGEVSLFATLLAAATESSPEAADAVADTLRHHVPSGWPARLMAWPGGLTEGAIEALADVLAGDGSSSAAPLLAGLRTPAAQASAAQLARHVRAGRVDWVPDLVEVVNNTTSPARRRAALLGLARLGSPHALVLARRWIAEPEVSHEVLGWIGGRDDALALLRQCQQAGATPVGLRALGWLGELSVVRPLAAWLGDDALADAAAYALQLITDDGPTETLPDPDDEPDDPADEDGRYGALRPGAALPRARATLTRPSRDALAWGDWLAQAKTRFVPGVRYRLGQPMSAQQLVQSLAADVPGEGYRQRAAEELALRYRPPHRLDTLASVARQRSTLAALAAWAPTHDSLVPNQGWQYAAAPV